SRIVRSCRRTRPRPRSCAGSAWHAAPSWGTSPRAGVCSINGSRAISLAKFSNRHIHRGKRLHWARAEEDGLPYRGAFAPMMTSDEFEERTVKVADPHAETFDLSKAEHKAVY